LRTRGPASLHNGVALVALDADFAQTVNTGMPYQVFLTPDGDGKGLYVSQKSATSFEAHELGGGSSSVAFDYRIMARRNGFENIRIGDLTVKTQIGRRLKAAKAGAQNAAPQPDAGKGPRAARRASTHGCRVKAHPRP